MQTHSLVTTLPHQYLLFCRDNVSQIMSYINALPRDTVETMQAAAHDAYQRLGYSACPTGGDDLLTALITRISTQARNRTDADSQA